MTKKKQYLLLAAAAVLLIALCIGAAAFSGGERPEGGAASADAPVVGTEKVTYTLILKSEGGKALEEVGVYFYTDSTLEELVWFAKTDSSGTVSFTDLESTGYVAVLDKVPDGYKVDPYYPLTGRTTEIILSTDMADGDLASLTYKLGDVMMNFSVTDVDGKTWVLSELLQEKQAVVLNFWYLQCAPCKAEFPHLQEAYEKYSDKIALLALNPINDSREEIAAFAVENGLTFPMAHCDPAWEKAMQLTAYPTTVIIDRFGTIALIHKGSIDEAKIFEDAFEFFTAEDYAQTTVENIEDLEITAQGTDSSNPIELGGVTSFEVTVGPGQMVYYHLYKVTNLTLTVSNRNIYAVYNNQTYPSGNGLSFLVNCPDTYTPAAVAFGNDSEEPQTFTVRLTAKPGSEGNPHVIKLGDFTVRADAGNNKGVFHVYTPVKSGSLTICCNSVTPAGIEYKIEADTENASGGTVQENKVTRVLGEESAVTIKVLKGVKVRIKVGAMEDESGSYPAASFNCTLSFEEKDGDEEIAKKLTYAVTVTDQDTVYVPNVKMQIRKVTEDAEAEEQPKDFNANEWGLAYQDLIAGTYEVVITSIPPGYEAATTRFRLTEERPMASIKLDEIVVVMKTYKVTVTDAEGTPMPNVMLLISGADPVTTDEQGRAEFTLAEGAYTVYATAPEGYVTDSNGYAFPEGGTELTIVLESAPEEVEPTEPEVKADYTIAVEDYEGNPQAGVYVQIMKGTALAAAVQTDSEGMAYASLSLADYTVTLSGTSMHYEPKLAVLPKGTTELTIRVAPEVSGTPEELYVGSAYYLHVGGNYVTMQANTINYYIFEPTEPGLYRFSTSDPAAILSYQGGSQFYIADMTASTDYDPATNSFTRNVKQSNIGGIIIVGVTGAPDCIIEVTRVSDPILDESDLVAEVYKAKTPPTAFKIPAAQGRKLKYLNLTSRTSECQIVMGSDGYYHLNSADGPLLYMNLGPNARYISMYNMLGFTGHGGTALNCVFRDANGSVIRKEDYTDCMCSYVEAIDPTYGVYPLTEDLAYMMQNGGGYKGWWDPNNANCVFLDEDGNLDPANLNLEIAWMFTLMYIPQ